MATYTERARALRPFIIKAAASLSDADALQAKELYARWAPDMVVKILEQLHFKAHEAMVVGDTSFDIIMGKKGGCITCGVTYGNGGQQELLDAGANHIINNFSDILKILRLEG